jgi:hypothetical protein
MKWDKRGRTNGVRSNPIRICLPSLLRKQPDATRSSWASQKSWPLWNFKPSHYGIFRRPWMPPPWILHRNVKVTTDGISWVLGQMICDILASPSLSSLNQTLPTRPPSSVQMNSFKQETIGSGFAPLRDLSSTAARSLNEQRLGATTQTPLLVSAKTPTDMMRSRGSSTLLNDTSSVKGPIEPYYGSPSSQRSAAPPSAQQPLSLGLSTSRLGYNRMPQRLEENGSVASFPLPMSQTMSTRSGIYPKPVACT